MIIVMNKQATSEDVRRVKEFLQHFDVEMNPIVGQQNTVIGLVGDTSAIDVESLSLNDGIEKIIKVQEPYKKANRKFHPENTVVRVGNVEIGAGRRVVMAGPCSVESEEQIVKTAKGVKESGAQILRGGAFKPRTSPYSFQGMKAEGLELLEIAKQETGLPIISELLRIEQIDLFMDKVDCIQVGARNMQNFELLKELGRVDKPVLLKRGFSSTIEEFLMSAEYVMSQGNENVILCERGIRTFETFTRNTLDISAVPALKRLSHLPVIVDPSHATGISWMVKPMAMAALAAGADGIMVEVHHNPKAALCDGAQSLTLEDFDGLMKESKILRG